MQEEQTQGSTPSESPETEGRSFRELFQDFTMSMRHYLNIREGVDIEGTVAAIKKDVEFKGYNIYILVFSIFIASIGLNVNSTAVIIGAMLISPLMGPIVGIGLAVGTTDIKLLLKSLKNLGLTVLFSVPTATLYFLISPIHDEGSELLARTTPTILDALIGIFGGLAGIMASSRKEKTNAVPGVAIATALMPPLCTAGYGLATGNLNYFFGAFYLFLLNSIFISLSAVVVVRYVGFPKVDYINPERERKVKNYIYTFITIVLIPSGFIFWNVIQESVFNQKANTFIETYVEGENVSVINSRIKYDSDGSSIELFLMGDRLSDADKDALVQRLTLEGLENTVLKIRQDKDLAGDIEKDLSGRLKSELKSGIIEEMYNENKKQLADKTQEIANLSAQLQRLHGDSVPGYVLRREVKIQYPEIASSYFATIENNLDAGRSDTIPTVFVRWKKSIKNKTKEEQSEKLGAWLQVRLNMDTIRVVEY